MNQARVLQFAGSIKGNPMVRRIASSFLSRVLGAVVNFALVIYLGRYLGAAQTGLYMIGFGAATLLSTVARLGLEQIVIREGGPLVRDSRWHALRRLHRRTLGLSCAAGIAIAVGLVLLKEIIAVHIFHQPVLGEVIPWFAASIVPLTFALIHVPFLQITNRPEGSIAVLSLWIPLASLPLLLLCHPRTGEEGAQIYFAACVFNALISLVQWCSFISRKRDGTDDARLPTDPPLLAPAVPLLIGNICQMALLWIAVFAVGVSTSPRDVGAYSIAQRVALTLSGFLVPPIDALIGPRLAIMRGVRTAAEIQQLVQRISSLLFIAAASVFAVILLYGAGILKLFGGEFGDGYGALVSLTFGQLVIVASGSIRPLLIVHGQEKMIRNSMIVAAACCVALCAALVPLLGPLGAAIGTSVALAVEKVVEGIIAHRKLGITVFPPVGLYTRHVKKWIDRRAPRRGV